MQTSFNYALMMMILDRGTCKYLYRLPACLLSPMAAAVDRIGAKDA